MAEPRAPWAPSVDGGRGSATCEPALAAGRLKAAGLSAATGFPFTGKGPVQEKQRSGRAGVCHGPQGGPAEAESEEQGAACRPQPLQAEGGRPRGTHPEEAVQSQEHQGAGGRPAHAAGWRWRQQGDAQVPSPVGGGPGTRGRQVGPRAAAGTAGPRRPSEPGGGLWSVGDPGTASPPGQPGGRRPCPAAPCGATRTTGKKEASGYIPERGLKIAPLPAGGGFPAG